MKVVLVTPLLDVGGSQRYVSELSNYWTNTGHQVTIIVLRECEIFYKISDDVRIIKCDFHYAGKLTKLSNGLKIFFKLRKIIKEIQPDFVLSVLSTTNILTIISSMFLKTNVIVRDSMAPIRKRNFVERISRKLLYPKADGVIAQTSEIKDFVEAKTGCKNVKVIPNPVRPFKIKNGNIREKIVLNVGALIARKGQKYFIDACAKINDPEWKFVILGEGAERDNLERQIKDLNIEDRIYLVGSVKNVDEWLLRSSIFVFPSLTEGLPNALMEALAAGLPCVSFDCETGPRNLIEDGENGFLVPIKDLGSMISKIMTLMSGPDIRERYSKKAIKSVEKFNTEIIAEEVLEFCLQS